MDTFLGLLFYTIVIYLFVKFKKASNYASGDGNRSIFTREPSKHTVYYVKGSYHHSGMTHEMAVDAYAEREELMKKYPNDVFHVESKTILM